MSPYSSSKIKVLSFFSILMIVLLHSHFFTPIYRNGLWINDGYNYFIQSLVSDGVTRIFVPLFFIISGYLFFLNFTGTKSSYFDKLKSRFKSLVIPYLFWSVMWIIIYWVLQIFAKGLFEGKPISDYTISDTLKAIFINPIPFQLWFIHDLAILVLCAPLIFHAIRVIPYVILPAFFVLWFIGFDLHIISNESLLYFSLGCFFAVKNANTPVVPKLVPVLSILVWMLLLILKTTLVYSNDPREFLIVSILKVSILVGLYAIWSLYDLVLRNKAARNFKIYEYTFFIYVFHIPLLTFVKKLIGYRGENEFRALISYFTVSIVTICICVAVAFCLKAVSKKCYLFVTGGR